MSFDKDMLFGGPRQETKKKVFFPAGEPEMSDFESAFLCGLIREKKPRIIVEFGVAAGGTTAIMLECLSQLGMLETTELYSIDCRESFYRGNGEKSGYLAEQLEAMRNFHYDLYALPVPFARICLFFWGIFEGVFMDRN